MMKKYQNRPYSYKTFEQEFSLKLKKSANQITASISTLFWLDRFGVWHTKVLWSYGQTVIYSSLFRLWKVLKYGEKKPILICLICFHISTTVHKSREKHL